ncbi:MAG: cytochrome c [Nitrospirota bacterium]|jgi:mono/diheme cytochrome c family protein
MRSFFSVLVLLLILAFAKTSIAADPSAIYKSKCALCHGAKGEGIKNMAPPHKGNKFVIEGKPEEIKKTILEGRIGKAKKYKEYPVDMPKNVMPDADAEALIKYLKTDLQK